MLNDAGYQLGSGSGLEISLTPPNEPEFGQILGISDLNNVPEFIGPVQRALMAIGIYAEVYEAKFIPEGELRIYVGMKPKS
jgi:hypothetical protein